MKKVSCVASLVFVVLGLGFVLMAQTKTPDFRPGDVLLGNSSQGQVVVFRPGNLSVTPQLDPVIETLSDGVGGAVPSSFLDNTLHLLVAAPGTNSGSSIVRFTILPTGSTPIQTVLNTFPASPCNGLSASNITSIAIDGKGNIFAGLNSSTPTLVELGPGGGCTTASTLSAPITNMDLNQGTMGPGGESLAYFTSGDKTIRTVNLPLTSAVATVSSFLSFSGNVNLSDIRVVPAGTLQGTCGANPCPSAESLLVVAQGSGSFCTGFNGVSAKSCVLLIDTSTKAVVAIYTIPGQDNLQSLTLDPIVINCTAGCSTNIPPATLTGFWVAPNSNNFYRVNIASGSNTPFNAKVSGLSISSLSVYSAVGANQSVPTEFTGQLTSALDAATFTFASNTMNISELPTPSGSTDPTNLLVLAAAIDPAGGKSDAGQDCTRSANQGTSCVVWQNASTPEAFYSIQLLSDPATPSGFDTPDNNTRGFRDAATDNTISLDYTLGGFNSSYGLYQLTAADEGCHYVPTTQFFDGATINSNRNSITFRFQCDSLPGAQLQTLAPPAPRISIVQLNGSGQPPTPFFPGVSTLVGGTCCTTADYRYDTSANQWVINVSFKGVAAGTRFDATTFIDSQNARAFHISFTYGGS